MKHISLLLIIVFSLFQSCKKLPLKQRESLPLNILFVGNSLTYTHDLPSLMAEIAMYDGVKLDYTSILLPNYSLEDHLNIGKVQTEIENGKYDFVVAQQGPSAMPKSQEVLLRDAMVLADLCKKTNKTKLALYMVWPYMSRFFDLDNVIYSYSNAAQKTASILCPAGLAWKYAWQADSKILLYGSDNFHPSLTGSVLAAMTIYAVLQEKNDFSFIRCAHMSWKKEISAAQFDVLKQAALKTFIK